MEMMNELIDFVINKKYTSLNSRKDELLKSNNLSEAQLNSFIHLMDDLELNKQGASILLQEIQSGRLVVEHQ